VVFVAAACFFSDPIRHAGLAILRGPFTLLKAFTTWLVWLPRAGGLHQDNRRLREELAQSRADLDKLREQRRHQQRTDALLAASPSPGGVVAEVIGRSPLPLPQTLRLNRGRLHGLTLEGIVLDGVGVVGRIAEMEDAGALVTLVTDPESRLGALVERSRELGLLVGRGRSWCELIYLQDDADVKEGDRVLTAGLDGGVPKGLALGTVVRVVRQREAGRTSAWVAPAAHLSRLEDVLCLPRLKTED
jgi:rod shape-determining protein MreC